MVLREEGHHSDLTEAAARTSFRRGGQGYMTGGGLLWQQSCLPVVTDVVADASTSVATQIATVLRAEVRADFATGPLAERSSRHGTDLISYRSAQRCPDSASDGLASLPASPLAQGATRLSTGPRPDVVPDPLPHLAGDVVRARVPHGLQVVLGHNHVLRRTLLHLGEHGIHVGVGPGHEELAPHSGTVALVLHVTAVRGANEPIGAAMVEVEGVAQRVLHVQRQVHGHQEADGARVVLGDLHHHLGVKQAAIGGLDRAEWQAVGQVHLHRVLDVRAGLIHDLGHVRLGLEARILRVGHHVSAKSVAGGVVAVHDGGPRGRGGQHGGGALRHRHHAVRADHSNALECILARVAGLRGGVGDRVDGEHRRGEEKSENCDARHHT
mmetsp:Transcript_755/g.2161  ORF Transcript_755/g.2161 Transcript_755/m.2161 type:complete len:383 (+) Transcript_755:96-1244(+)